MKGSQNQKVDSVMAKPIKDHAFATPDKVAELVQKVCVFLVFLSAVESRVREGHLYICLLGFVFSSLYIFDYSWFS